MEKQYSLLDYLFTCALEGRYTRISSEGILHHESQNLEIEHPPVELADFVDLPVDMNPLTSDIPFMIYPPTALQLSLLYECQIRPESTAFQINAPSKMIPAKISQIGTRRQRGRGSGLVTVTLVTGSTTSLRGCDSTS